MRQVRIAIGLPASGKTTFYRHLAEKDQSVVHLDENALQSFQAKTDQNDHLRTKPLDDNSYRNRLREYKGFDGALLLDGLFLSTERIECMLDEVLAQNEVKEIVLDYWPENRERCMCNDYKRRRQGSSLSIQILSICVDFQQLIHQYSNRAEIRVEQHEIYQVPDYVLFFRDYGLVDLTDERYLDSDTWSVGGSSRSCAGDWVSIDPDKAPTTFRELDELLIWINPKIPFSLVNRIKEQCVSINERTDRDYYSTVNLRFFRCDLEKLWEIMSQSGFLKHEPKDEQIPPSTLCPNCQNFHGGAHAAICRNCIRNSFQEFMHVCDTRMLGGF